MKMIFLFSWKVGGGGGGGRLTLLRVPQPNLSGEFLGVN